jgi:HD superfamily phosphodiesterase
MSIVARADAFAADAHRGQTRKGTDTPYIEHPRAVARVLAEAGCDDETVAAALLHDTVEDVEHVELADIEAAFGAAIAGLVAGVTEDKSRNWEERKRTALRGVVTGDTRTALVGLADRLDNMRALAADLAEAGDRVWRHFNAPRTRQRRYHRTMVAAFEARDDLPTDLVTAYRRQVDAVFPAMTSPLGPLLREVRERMTNTTSTIHGDAHWRTVATIAHSLLDVEPLADPAVVFAFALLHDAMRRDDGRDPLHGPRAAALAKDLHRDGALRLADHQLSVLCSALAAHADGTTTGDPTTAVCWDADRLTLGRVGIRPDARFLSSAAPDWDAWIARWDGVWATEDWPALSLPFAERE